MKRDQRLRAFRQCGEGGSDVRRYRRAGQRGSLSLRRQNRHRRLQALPRGPKQGLRGPGVESTLSQP